MDPFYREVYVAFVFQSHVMTRVFSIFPFPNCAACRGDLLSDIILIYFVIQGRFLPNVYDKN